MSSGAFWLKLCDVCILLRFMVVPVFVLRIQGFLALPVCRGDELVSLELRRSLTHGPGQLFLGSVVAVVRCSVQYC